MIGTAARNTERHTECAYYIVCVITVERNLFRSERNEFRSTVITPVRGARFQRAIAVTAGSLSLYQAR
jgi:hypothetical protein